MTCTHNHQPNHRIRAHLVIIAGFTQKRGKGGANDLWRRARALYEPQVAVHRVPWNEDFRNLADSIYADSYGQPKIVVAAYSWGVGHGMPALADGLAGHGMTIETVVASDAIYHSLFRVAAALSPLQPRIAVPFNVRRLEWFKQETDKWLRSPGFVARNDATEIAEPVVLPRYDHKGMDNASEWHDRVIEVTRQVCFPTRGG